MTFAQSMIPHHEQAVEMAQVATERAADERVRDVARRIEAAQEPEIEQMQEWRSWRQVGDLAGVGPVVTTAEGVAFAATDGGEDLPLE